MSFHVFFDFSTGLAKPIHAPAGTLDRIIAHVEFVEKTLGLDWENMKPKESVSDEIYCKTAGRHNRFVRWLYSRFEEWSKKPVENGEVITPDAAKKFWHGLHMINVPTIRWTKDYYQDRMEHVFNVLIGDDDEGVTLGEKALKPKQAAAVIRLFQEYFENTVDLEVPNGCYFLTDDYVWCEKCGPNRYEDVSDCRKRKCPLREEFSIMNK